MTTISYQKTVHASYLAGITGLVTMPDVIFGLLLELMHTLLELAHLLFEFIESTLDHIVEHIFHTGVHETQIIVFYLIFTIGLIALYYLCRSIPNAVCKLRNNFLATLTDYKTSAIKYWVEQSLIDKLKLIVLLNTGMACLFFFSF
jgi:hypothetical protein